MSDRPKWQADALCAAKARKGEIKLSDFYHVGDKLDVVSLRRICLSCPVIEECRQFADEMSPSYGFFAGETVEERSWRRRHPGCRRAKE